MAKIMAEALDLKSYDQRVIIKGILQEKTGTIVRCHTCNHNCNIREGRLGVCKTRVNVNGEILSLCYGNVSSVSNNPIEKKPFFHFAPSTKALTVGSWSCNASCSFCQNHDISKTPPTPGLSKYMSPESFVERAKRNSDGISISFNEAATLMLEWNLEVFRLAHEQGLYNTIVTNGYMTREALDLMIDAGLDAANVDIKGCRKEVLSECSIDVDSVWSNVGHMLKRGVHVELTTLVVPGLSDNMECAKGIAQRIVEIDPSIPWHINRYFPHYKYGAPATSIDLLKMLWSLANRLGVEFVYIGNLWRKGYEDTICPQCGTICYERHGFRSFNAGVDDDGRCIFCKYDLGIKFWRSYK